MSAIAALKRKATIAGQDRDTAIRQRQDAQDKLEALVEQIAKAKPGDRGDLVKQYAEARDTVEALSEAVEKLSDWADSAAVAVLQEELDQAAAEAQKAGQARKEQRGKLNEHLREMRMVHNGSHPKQQELEGDALDEWREQMVATEATLKERGRQVQRDHNRAALKEQQAQAALEELQTLLSGSE